MKKKKKKMDCEEAIRHLLEFLDHELDAIKHSELETHLHTCRSCYSRMEFEKRLKKMVKDAKEVSASDTLRARIKKISTTFN